MGERRAHRPGTRGRTRRWRSDVVAHNIDVLRYMRRRPWVLDGVVARPPSGPNAVRRVEQMLARLASCPAPGSGKMEAIGVIAGMVQTAVHERPGGGGALDEEFLAAQSVVLIAAAQDGNHPHLAAVFAEPPPAVVETGDVRMARILRLVLDGCCPTTAEPRCSSSLPVTTRPAAIRAERTGRAPERRPGPDEGAVTTGPLHRWSPLLGTRHELKATSASADEGILHPRITACAPVVHRATRRPDDRRRRR